MPAERLAFTDRRIADLKLPKNGRAVYLDWDDPNTKNRKAVAGLQLVVSATGTKSFVLCRKLAGKVKKVTIGRFPTVPVELARKLAKEASDKISEGISPTDEKRAERVKGVLLSAAFADYVKGHKLSQNTNDNYHTIIRKYFYDWQARPLKEITREMVIARHSAITDGKLKAGPDYKPSHMKPSPSSANKAMRLLRSIYNFSNIHYDEGPEVAAIDNPVIRITALKKWNKEGSRSTRLFDGDLKPWFEAVLSLKGDPDSFSDTAADFLIFLLLTGLRRREASTLKWVDVNLRSSFFTILETKNGIPHKLPLTDYLLTMMKERRLNVPGEYVFSGWRQERQHRRPPASG